VQLEDLIDDAMVVRRLRVKNEDVVFVKGTNESAVTPTIDHAQRVARWSIVAPLSRTDELDAVLRDLARELGGTLDE